MPSFSYDYTLTNGTTANADHVMANFNNIRSLLVTIKLDADNIQAGALTNALISATAGIVHSKLAATTPGYVLLGTTTTGAITGTPLSGDVTISPTGVTAITAGAIVNADVSASAAIAYSKLALTGSILNADLASGIAVSKLATGTANQILLNNATPLPEWRTVSGDLTNALGVFTISNDAVSSSKLSVTSGEVRATNANQGLTIAFADLVGMTTGAITPPSSTTEVDVDVSVQFGGATGALAGYVRVFESINGGAFNDLTTSVYGAAGTEPTALMTGAAQQPSTGASFTRTVNPANTYTYKVQVAGSIANGNAIKGLGTFIRWRFLK